MKPCNSASVMEMPWTLHFLDKLGNVQTRPTRIRSLECDKEKNKKGTGLTPETKKQIKLNI